MPADFTIKQGDTEPVLAEQIRDSTGEPVDLDGANVRLQIRTLTSPEPLTLTGAQTIPDSANGIVQWQPSVQDTQTPGEFMATWIITYANGAIQTYPTIGYIWITIEENLTTEGGQQLVSLPEVKDHLHVPATNRTHDSALTDLIQDVRPVVEEIVGPVIPQIFDEWHDGGQSFIQIRRRPQTGFGTSPILNLIGVDEYVGAARYPLTLIGEPSGGTMYSVQMDRLGKIVRRTSGGGQTPFRGATNSVHVTYRAGQQTIPRNVRRGTLELIRVNYETTQGVGTGRQTVADVEDMTGPPMSFFVPRRVRELLAPTRRAPSIA